MSIRPVQKCDSQDIESRPIKKGIGASGLSEYHSPFNSDAGSAITAAIIGWHTERAGRGRTKSHNVIPQLFISFLQVFHPALM